MLAILMLSLALNSADLACPPAPGLLALSPHVIIGKYGENMAVNCSTTAKEYERMFLLFGNNTCETYNSSLECSAPLTVFDMKAECKIKFKDSGECTEEFEVIVYQLPEVILSLETLRASENQTEYRLTCDVLNAAPVQNLTVTWYKNDVEYQTESINETSKHPVNVSYDRMVSISREDDVLQFKCDAQLQLGPEGPQYPVISQTYNLSAQYAPELKMNSTVSISLIKGASTTLICDVDGNPFPHYKWISDSRILSYERELSLTNITNATYTCTATNDLGNITVQIHVDIPEEYTEKFPPLERTEMQTSVPITEKPKPQGCLLEMVPSEVVVKYGDPVTITCNMSRTDIAIMGWEAAIGNISNTPPVVTLEINHFYDFTVEPFCYATLENGEQCTKKPTITLYKLPDSISVSVLGAGPMLEDNNYNLSCIIENVAPVDKVFVTWYHGNKTLKDDLAEKKRNENISSKATPLNVSSIYKFRARKDNNGTVFRCEINLELGPKGPERPPSAASDPYVAVVHYKPSIYSCKHELNVPEFSRLQMPCKFDGNPPPDVRWYYKGKLINSSMTLNRTDSGNYTIEVFNIWGSNSTSVFISVGYSPSLTCDEKYKVKANEKPVSVCELDGVPSPSLTWYKHEQEMALPERWMKHHSGSYLLKASNQYGEEKQHISVDVLYAPEFSEGNSTKEFILGRNVTFECTAEGNPSPQIIWTYNNSAQNLMETTVGRKKILTIKGATSANSGLYTCIALNELGNLTRTVRLVEEANANAPQFLWVLVPLSIFIILLLLLLFYNRWRKQGQYSFVATNDSLYIPMSTKSTGGKNGNPINGAV